MLQQHPHHRGLGDDGIDPLLQAAVLGKIQQILVKARAVVGPHRGDPPLHRCRAEHPRVHRQVPTLGVAAQPQLPPGILPGHLR